MCSKSGHVGEPRVDSSGPPLVWKHQIDFTVTYSTQVLRFSPPVMAWSTCIAQIMSPHVVWRCRRVVRHSAVVRNKPPTHLMQALRRLRFGRSVRHPHCYCRYVGRGKCLHPPSKVNPSPNPTAPATSVGLATTCRFATCPCDRRSKNHWRLAYVPLVADRRGWSTPS